MRPIDNEGDTARGGLADELQIHELSGFVHVDGDGTISGLSWNFRAKYRKWGFAVAKSPQAEAWRVAWAPFGDGTRYEWGEEGAYLRSGTYEGPVLSIEAAERIIRDCAAEFMRASNSASRSGR